MSQRHSDAELRILLDAWLRPAESAR